MGLAPGSLGRRCGGSKDWTLLPAKGGEAHLRVTEPLGLRMIPRWGLVVFFFFVLLKLIPHPRHFSMQKSRLPFHWSWFLILPLLDVLLHRVQQPAGGLVQTLLNALDD